MHSFRNVEKKLDWCILKRASRYKFFDENFVCAGPPDPPAGLPSVKPSGPTSVVVNWSSPAFDGGHKLAGYIVEVRIEDVDEVWTEAARSSHALSAVVCNSFHLRWHS